jgi:sugar phosphate permease
MQARGGAKLEAVIPVLGDRRMWAIAVCSVSVMTLYALWLNWTTIFFVQHLGLTQDVANRYFAWLPPLFATFGGLVGGWLAFRKIGNEENAIKVRLILCWACVPLCLVTALVPVAGTPSMAALGIGVSFFACMMIVTNLHVMPIDIFGKERAAFTTSILTFCFALAQTVTAPIMGGIVDRFGFAALCGSLAVLPLFGLCVVTLAVREHTRERRVVGAVRADEHAVL